MNERDLFLAALDITDPEARRNYLDQACGGNAALRASVEALFASHDGAGSFLKTPLVQPACADSASDTAVEKPSDAMERTVHLSQEHQAVNSEDDDTDDHEIPLGFLSPSTKPDSLGRLGHYEVLEVLGKGAFGTVLKAFDEKLHRMVAIKVMSAELASTSPARKRFLREARSAAAIRHDNVVAIHAVEEEPIPYLVMEYIPGQTLQQFLDAHGPLDVTDTLRLSQQMASGLAAAHAQGLIHRDIKPSNILLEDGIQRKVKISDFGLARAADDASMTQSGTIAGTPLYMSPEQAHSNRIDQRSDLFSFGSVLYQMVSGRPPFRASSTLAVLKRVTEDTPRPIQDIIPEVPDWLCTIISKLHSKQPADRYQTANEVAELLARCQSELQHAGKVTCVQSSPQSSHHSLSDESPPPAPPSTSRPSPNQTPSPPAAAQPIAAPQGSSRRSETATFNRPRLIAASIIGTVAIIAILMLNRFNNSTDPASGGRQPSGTSSEISNSKSQISNPESEILDLKSQIFNDPPTDPDRRAAEYVLSIGDGISIKEKGNGQERQVYAVGDLPRGPFELTEVNLFANPKVIDAGLVIFQDCRNVTHLDLGATSVSDAGLVHFKACKDLKMLDLQQCPLVSDVGLANFKDCRGLVHLDLFLTKVGDAGLAAFKDCKKLSVLILERTQVSDDGLANFQGCQSLTVLRLGTSSTTSRITDAGLTYFKDCQNIVFLDLNGLRVTDSGLANFKNCQQLTALHLVGVPFSDTGLAHFKECKNLTVLDLYSTQVSDAGVVNFKDCKNLTLLDLRMTKVSDAGLVNFQNCQNLTDLYLAGTAVTDAGLAYFKECKSLSVLYLHFTQVSDAGLVHFQNCQNLTRLHLNATQVTDTGLACFKGCKDLVDLNLELSQVSDAALPDLKSLPNLATLNLASTRISHRGHEQLKAALPKCQITWSEPNRSVVESVLALGGSVEIGALDQPESRPVQVAADLPGDYFQVRRVSLAGVTKPLDPLRPLLALLTFPQFDRLESIDLSGSTGLDYSFLVPIHGLRELTLANAGLNDAALANLPKLNTLQRLVLDGNDIRGAGLTHLSHQSELIDLSLSHPNLTNLSAENLAELKPLKRLSLAGSGMTNAGIKHLASLTNLESLDLRRTKATAAGIAELQLALPMCQIASDFSDVAGEEAGK